MSADPKDWIAVAAIPSLGASSVKRLWDMGWTPERLLTSSVVDWQQLGLKERTKKALSDYQHKCDSAIALMVKKALQWQRRYDDASILPITHSDYPALLREIYDPPPVVFIRGSLDALNLPQLAIVGSRHASKTGARNAHAFAAYLTQHGVIINSGLAQGIDTAAHQACVDNGAPTVAVLGTGIDTIYPATNRMLSEKILANGGVWLSEFFPGTPPRAANFPRRNRLISGMSMGVLVVEAAIRSGSLITARVAAEQGREVFAMPGALNNPLSKGGHQLIREGATLVESAEDIVAQLSPLLGFIADELEKSVPDASLSHVELLPEEQRVVQEIGYEIAYIDDLCEATGLNIAELGSLLVELEIKGIVEQQGGGYICC